MASIRKRDRKWQVQVRRKGYPLFTRTFHEKADALKWARQTESDLDKGLHPHLEGQTDLKTVGDVLRRYRDTITNRKRGREPEEYRLNAILRDRLADWPLKALTANPFSDYRDRRLEEVAPDSVRKELQLLQHAIGTAMQEWAVTLPSNPVAKVRKPAPGKARDRRLDAQEMARLIEATRSCRNPVMRPLVLLAMETGMRQGELLTLRWDDIDLKERLAQLHETKNGWPRTVPLSSRAVAILRLLRRHAKRPLSGRVFPTSGSAVKQSWKRLVRRAGVPDLHFHDLRHEAISRLFERGLNVPQVALISGHRDIRQLQRYTHLKAADIVKKLSRTIA